MGDPKITIINGLPINDLNGDGVFRSSDGDSILLRDARSCSCREASMLDGEDERKYLFDYLSITKLEGVRIESLKRYAETVSAIKVNALYGSCASMEFFIKGLSGIAKEANIEGSDVTKAIQSIDTAGCYKKALTRIEKQISESKGLDNIPEGELVRHIKEIRSYLKKAGVDGRSHLIVRLEAEQKKREEKNISLAERLLLKVSNIIMTEDSAFAGALKDRGILRTIGDRIIAPHIKTDLDRAKVTWVKNGDGPNYRELFIETTDRKFKIAIVKMENGYSHRAFHIRKMPQTEGPPAKRRLSF